MGLLPRTAPAHTRPLLRTLRRGPSVARRRGRPPHRDAHPAAHVLQQRRWRPGRRRQQGWPAVHAAACAHRTTRAETHGHRTVTHALCPSPIPVCLPVPIPTPLGPAAPCLSVYNATLSPTGIAGVLNFALKLPFVGRVALPWAGYTFRLGNISRCSLHSECGRCTADAECGWDAHAASCEPGTARGSTCRGEANPCQWFFAGCPSVASCTSRRLNSVLMCGWCSPPSDSDGGALVLGGDAAGDGGGKDNATGEDETTGMPPAFGSRPPEAAGCMLGAKRGPFSGFCGGDEGSWVFNPGNAELAAAAAVALPLLEGQGNAQGKPLT